MAFRSELESLGFSPSEVRVYEALLRLGSTTAGPVIKETGLQGSVTYRALDRLMERGLVGAAMINGVRRFTAEPPKRIIEYLDERKASLEGELGALERLAGTAAVSQKAALFEGLRGVKNVWGEDVLKLPSGSTVYVLGAPPRSIGLELYFRNFQKRRAAKGIHYRIIFQQSARDVARDRAKMPLLEARVMPEGFDSPVWFGVYGERAVVGVWTREPLTLVIDDADVVRGLMQYFDFMWKLSKPVQA